MRTADNAFGSPSWIGTTVLRDHLPDTSANKTLPDTVRVMAAPVAAGETVLRVFPSLDSLGKTAMVDGATGEVGDWQYAQPAMTPDPLHYREGAQDPSLNDRVKKLVSRAHALFDTVTKNKLFVGLLDANITRNLPIGINKDIGGISYTIVIDSVVLTPRGAYLVAYMSIELPQSGRRIAFRGTNIQFSQTAGLTGDATLELLEDGQFMIGDRTLVTILANETKVVFDCNGFKNMQVKGTVEFSRDFLIPEKPDGSLETDPKARVKASFTTQIQEWSDFLVGISLTPFQVNGLSGVTFKVDDAWFDASDLNNPPGIVFPTGYQSPAVQSGSPNLWRGLFIKNFSVKLPPWFKKRSSAQRVEIAAYEVLVDAMGFTGTISGRNLLTLEEGTIAGWSFSMDEITVRLQANTLTDAGFAGAVVLPVSKGGQGLGYKAVISAPNDYLFTVTLRDNLNFPLWQAGKVRIAAGSSLEVGILNGNFQAAALLNGRLTINAGFNTQPGEDKSDEEGSSGFKLADVRFEGLRVATVRPFLAVKAFNFGTD
jgi:hypothetical protein